MYQGIKILHIDCIADALGIAQDNMNSKNFYGYNPAFDKDLGKTKNC